MAGSAAAIVLVFVSFSQNAWSALILAPFVAYLVRRLKNGALKFIASTTVASFFLTIVNVTEGLPREIAQRVELNSVAGKLMAGRPVFGVGLGAFITKLPEFADKAESWWLQPVHNIYLLITSELGIFGLLAFVYLIYKNTNKHNLLPVVAILLTGMWDHYWISIFPASALLFIVLGLRD